MDIFDIIGPVMVGPSSSHTAGAVRIGYIAGKLMGEPIAKAEIFLYGSFLATGKGHGTRKALAAGLLGMKPDDMRIPDSFEIAKCLVLDKVVEHDVMAETIDELQKSNATFDEWRALEKYNTGTSTASKMHGHCITVNDGVLVVVLGNGNNPQVKMTDFMSDDDLFGTSLTDDHIDCDLYTVWPLLPVDKDF